MKSESSLDQLTVGGTEFKYISLPPTSEFVSIESILHAELHGLFTSHNIDQFDEDLSSPFSTLPSSPSSDLGTPHSPSSRTESPFDFDSEMYTGNGNQSNFNGSNSDLPSFGELLQYQRYTHQPYPANLPRANYFPSDQPHPHQQAKPETESLFRYDPFAYSQSYAQVTGSFPPDAYYRRNPNLYLPTQSFNAYEFPNTAQPTLIKSQTPPSPPSPSESYDEEDSSKARISWTSDLHNAFVRAYNTLGDEATPKKIMQIMREQGVPMKSMTRLKIASHLQRHEKKLGLARRPSVTKKLVVSKSDESNSAAHEATSLNL